MKNGKKQQKFHESLVQMLYPSSRSPPRPQAEEIKEKEKKLNESLYDLPDELGYERRGESGSSGENSEDGNVGSEKLTRAQRKRLRKWKLKEDASQRRKIIGPLLPGTIDGGKDGTVECVPESVRQNTIVRLSSTVDSCGESASSSKQNKLKQRRKSKKLADTKLNSSSIDR